MMLDILNHFKEEEGILLGVCDASRMDWLTPVLAAGQTPFVSRNAERRLNPRAVMPSAESVVVIGVGCQATPLPTAGMNGAFGALASVAVGEDYHVRVSALLTELAQRLCRIKPFRYKIYTDAGHLNERALAVKAGLGFIGKNGFIISETFGSFFNIGYMLTDLALPPQHTPARADACGSCRRCIDACPSGAAAYDGRASLHVQACIAYLTQKKGPLTAREEGLIGDRLYGCDTCQNVCPYNAHVARCDISQAYLPLEDCINITDEAFERRFSSSALSWRGAAVFRRNAAIAAKNHATTVM